jgi:hypothetical protein
LENLKLLSRAASLRWVAAAVAENVRWLPTQLETQPET